MERIKLTGINVGLYLVILTGKSDAEKLAFIPVITTGDALPERAGLLAQEMLVEAGQGEYEVQYVRRLFEVLNQLPVELDSLHFLIACEMFNLSLKRGKSPIPGIEMSKELM